MISEELQTWVHAQNEKLSVRYRSASVTEREWLYARVVKLSEEVGELSAEVLAESGYQRQDKLDARDNESLANEIADVLICVLLLADTMNVDPNNALRKKIEKIDKRFADVEAG